MTDYCGTIRGLKAHQKLNEPPCKHCQRASIPPAKSPIRRKAVAECGTPSGYTKHKRVGEDACKPCKDAAAAARSRVRNKEGK